MVHIISRFVNREFRIAGSEERREYLRRVGRQCRRSDWRPLAYALMSTHIHWVALAGNGHPSELFRPIHTGFAVWLNRRQGRLGPVFASRFRTIPVSGDSAAALIAYVHNNPVRAGVVKHAEQSDWTSHRALLGLELSPPWLDVDSALRACGLSCDSRGRRGLAAAVRSRELEGRQRLWDAGAALQTDARHQLGTSHLGICMADAAADGESSTLVGTLPEDAVMRPRWPGTPQLVLEVVARVSGVSLEELASTCRRRDVVGARRLSLLVWARHLGRAQCDMAAALGISAQAASRLLAGDQSALRSSAKEVAARVLRSRRKLKS